MKSTKILAATAAAAMAASTLGLAAPSASAAGCTRSGYDVAGVTVIDRNGAPMGHDSNGPIYLDWRKYKADTDGSEHNAGVMSPLFLTNAAKSDPVDVALDYVFAPLNFYIYAEYNNRAGLQTGTSANPTDLNAADGCGDDGNPDMVIY